MLISTIAALILAAVVVVLVVVLLHQRHTAARKTAIEKTVRKEFRARLVEVRAEADKAGEGWRAEYLYAESLRAAYDDAMHFLNQARADNEQLTMANAELDSLARRFAERVTVVEAHTGDVLEDSRALPTWRAATSTYALPSAESESWAPWNLHTGVQETVPAQDLRDRFDAADALALTGQVTA